MHTGIWGALRNRLGRRRTLSPIELYLTSERQPWSAGYEEYRTLLVEQTLRDDDLMQRFRRNQTLPKGYGSRLDERVVEYPWALSKLSTEAVVLLDAGGALDHCLFLRLPLLGRKPIIIYALALEGRSPDRANVSYIQGDLRCTILRDELVDEIVCISTLEHIGMDNTLLYTKDTQYKEACLTDYQKALLEFKRLLKRGGKVYLTVPYGRYHNFGWLQQFDRRLLEDALRTFDGDLISLAFYCYVHDEWNIAEQESCDECVYYDTHSAQGYDVDLAAAARAVACVELRKW